ncbi:hypothetical protein OUZ56_015759 [Daphnia magna]|uniref:Uncharacterized protein n=1 Tax=Daphnia magna TaxID=35525 RepID=A0ABR0ANN1_9CRUS|nr:hypothetical protein OUZ56_015759 [Daphnia magna]
MRLNFRKFNSKQEVAEPHSIRNLSLGNPYPRTTKLQSNGPAVLFTQLQNTCDASITCTFPACYHGRVSRPRSETSGTRQVLPKGTHLLCFFLMKMSSLAKQVALGETKCYCTTVSVTDTQIIIRRKTRIVRKIEKNQSARREGERVDGSSGSTTPGKTKLCPS